MDKRPVALAWCGLLVAYALGALVPVMDVDAAQYASMSAQMLREGNWLQVFDRDVPYLDKPPLLFWLSAASLKIFGHHTWAYKLPSILFALAGCWALFRFTKLHHDARTAHTAALVYGSSVAMLQMTNDVRCDTLLTANTMLAIWSGMAWLKSYRMLHLLLTGAFLGLAMLAKGPIGVVVPALAIGGHVAITGQWRALRDVRLLLLPAMIALLLVPMCVGLYEQHGSDGLRFYFWDQSFGRITGTNRWKDDSTGFFFLHTFLWVALPWTLFALHGLWLGFIGVVRRTRQLPEYATLCGIVLTVLALSFSHYKLPHYLFVIMPLASVLAARSLCAVYARLFALLQLLVALLVPSAALWTAIVAFPAPAWWSVAAVVGAAAALVIYARSDGWGRSFWPTIAASCAAAWVINGHFYPSLLRFQAGTMVGDKSRTLAIPQGDLLNFATVSRALDFHAGHSVPWLRDISEADAAIRPGVHIYCNEAGRADLVRAARTPQEEWSFPAYPVQVLSWRFLSPATRDSVVGTHYLLRY